MDNRLCGAESRHDQFSHCAAEVDTLAYLDGVSVDEDTLLRGRGSAWAQRWREQRRTNLVQAVQERVIRGHRAESATRPPVGSELGFEEVLLDVEGLGELGDVLWVQLRLKRGAISKREEDACGVNVPGRRTRRRPRLRRGRWPCRSPRRSCLDRVALAARRGRVRRDVPFLALASKSWAQIGGR